VEILVVLVVLGVLGGIGYAATTQYRAHAAEAELRQDLIHFVNQQQSLRERTGALGSLRQVEERGYRVSPGVLVEDSRVDARGRRAYLRVLHRKTGQRCSVDYSPFVSTAANRIQCWGGTGDDPAATERVATTEVEVASPVTDTMSVDTTGTPGPETPLVCQATTSPGVTGPADRSDPELGGTYADAFTLTNPNAAARTYTLTFSSSNPSVVPSVNGPQTVTVGAGASQAVPAQYRVDAGAEAGQVAVLPVEVADAECPGARGDAFFSVTAPLRLGALELTGPGAVTVRPGAAIPAVWRSLMRTNSTRMMVLEPSQEPGLELQTTDGAGRQAYQNGVQRSTPLEYRLDPRIDGFERRRACMLFYDALESGHRIQACFDVTAEFIPGAPQVAVAAPQEAGQGETFTAVWTVTNTSNAARPFSITPAVTGDVAIQSSEGTGASVVIPRGGERTVRVTYRINDRSVAGTINRGTLQVLDVDGRYVPPSSGAGAFETRTRLEVCAPTVATPPAAQTVRPGAEAVASWTLHNCTNAPRTLTLTPAGDGDVSPASTARGELFQPFEDRAVSFTFRMRDRSVAGTVSRPTLSAADGAAAGAASPFVVTTETVLCAPTLAGPAGVPAQPQDPGTGAAVVHTVTNCSNAPRTFATRVTSSNPAAVPDPDDPAPFTLAPYGAAQLPFAYAIPPLAVGAQSSDLVLRIWDAGDASLAGESGFRVTTGVIVRAPDLTPFPAQTVLPGQAGRSAATLTSRSNVPVAFCFQTSLSPGTAPAGAVVASAPATPGCIDVAPYGTAEVPQSFQVVPGAEHPLTNTVAVRAYDQARPNLAAPTQPFAVTAGLVLANPELRLPNNGLPFSLRGNIEHSLNYGITNLSNARREICLEVLPETDALVAISPVPLCAVLGAGDSLTLPHIIRTAKRDDRVWVNVRVFDRTEPRLSVGARYSVKLDFHPLVARLRVTGTPYLRRWMTFDGSASTPGDGGVIVKHIWYWGLPFTQWSSSQNRFVPTGLPDEASDETIDAIVQRAYDTSGPRSVCLRVVDESGAVSDTSCVAFTPAEPTAARVAWKYRGWWTDHDLCIDVWWDNQCTPEHGNGRWEITLKHSQKSSPIQQARARVTVWLHNTDDPNRPRVHTYSNNDSPPDWGEYQFDKNYPAAGGPASAGRWRVLNTDGTDAKRWPRPLLGAPVGDHPLVLNVNLAKATGMFDGGPHWVPDSVVVTLEVRDSDGTWTSSTAGRNHRRSAWKDRYEQGPAGESPPTASVLIETVTEGSEYRATGSGFSPEGRIVDSWWEIWREPIGDPGAMGSGYTVRAPFVNLEPGVCEQISVVLVVKDDRGRTGVGGSSVSGSGDYRSCSPTGTEGDAVIQRIQ
jgi:hypothetical protein